MSSDYETTSLPNITERKLCVATYQFTPQHADEMPLEVGDVMEISQFRENEWVMGKKVFKDEAGIIPPSFIKLIEPSTTSKPTYCKAIYDYDALNEDEVSFCDKEIVKVLKTDCETGWMVGENMSTRKIGLFPINYVDFVCDIESDIQLLLNSEKHGRRSSDSREEAYKENMRPGFNLKAPEIVFKNGDPDTEEAPLEVEKDEEYNFGDGSRAEFEDDGHGCNFGHVEEHKDATPETSTKEFTPAYSVKNATRDNSFMSSNVNLGVEHDEDLSPKVSEMDSKDGDYSSDNDGNALGDKTADAHPTVNEADSNEINNDNQSFVLPNAQHALSGHEASHNDDEIAKNSEAVPKTDAHDDQIVQCSSSAAKGYTNPLMFQIVNDPTVVDYEYHIEKDENNARPGYTSYSAMVKWTVKNDR